MALIIVPYIDKRTHFGTIMTLYDAVANKFNEGVKLERDNGDLTRNPLRSSHRELFRELVHIANGQLEQMKYRFRNVNTITFLQRDSRCPYSIKTNRKALNMRTKKSEASVYRQLERLLEAGVLSCKKNHGPTRDFEVFINPDILPISCDINEDFDPVADIFRTSKNQVVTDALRSICTVYHINKNISNKVIIPERQVVNSSSFLYKEQSRTFDRNTGSSEMGKVRQTSEGRGGGVKIDDLTRVSAASSQRIGKVTKIDDLIKIDGLPIIVTSSAAIDAKSTSKIDDYAVKMQKERDLHDNRLRKFAQMLSEFIISMLFSSRTIYDGERRKMYQNAEWYFKDLSGANAYNVAFEVYKRRVLLAKTYLDNHPDRMSNVWPARYMDPENNTSGFIMTDRWLKKDNNWTKIKKYKTAKNTENQIYHHVINKFTSQRNLATYNWAVDYLKAKAPKRLDDFHLASQSIVNQNIHITN